MVDLVTAPRFFAVMFCGCDFDAAVEVSSRREAAAMIHGYGLSSDNTDGDVCVDGVFARYEYLVSEYPHALELAQEYIGKLFSRPRLVGQRIDYAGRITVETWAKEDE